MRVIVAGSREINVAVEYLSVIVIESGFTPSVIISGHARGADKLGEDWAKLHDIPCEKYPADWDKYGKRAGFMRNEYMASKADALIALWDGNSRGTKHMIETMQKLKLPIFIWRSDVDNHTGTTYTNNEIQDRRCSAGMVHPNSWDI